MQNMLSTLVQRYVQDFSWTKLQYTWKLAGWIKCLPLSYTTPALLNS